MEKTSIFVHVVEQEHSSETITVTSVAAAPTAQHEDIQSAVGSFESAIQDMQFDARQVVCTEVARVNKRLMQLQKEQQQQPRKKLRRALTEEMSREQEVLLNQLARSRKMMQLLQRLEQVQDQLLDEMNACADDADQVQDQLLDEINACDADADLRGG
jgi:translation initiation factor 2B subunit (eIF-2B alpha/beta/delta family)